MLGAQVVCPKRLDSVEVLNKMASPCTVSVAYDNHRDSTEILEEQVLEPGASFHFQAKELNMGTWTAVAPIKRVTCTHAQGSSSLEPVVSGVVTKTAIHVGETGQLTQP